LSERSSLLRFRLKKALDLLASKQGRGTELISLYVAPGRQISDVIKYLRQEYATASNIKSRTTRKNVQEAIDRVTQRLKLFKEPPPTGLVIFCGAIPKGGPGSEEMEIYTIVPPEPIRVHFYRCDDKFVLEPLEDMLKEKETFGIIVLDTSEASFATLKGRHVEIIKEITSGIAGKTRAGGQSARRYERIRDHEVSAYYTRIAEYAAKIFLEIPDIKGLVIGGPGPSKYDFVEDNYLDYRLKERILATVDTAYVGPQGVEEVVERSSEVFKNVRYIEEKNLVQQFLYQIGHDTGLGTYGEEEVRNCLSKGAVSAVLVSEALDLMRQPIECTVCHYHETRTIRSVDRPRLEQELLSKNCPRCLNQSLSLGESKDMIDELAELAEESKSDIQVISSETEEGQMLLKSFGGIAALLRFKC
jgi:peptide chain release factor subunit 1